MINKKVSIIGLGYIGLPTAATIASKKIKVIGVDIDIEIINSINNGKSHFHEKGLSTILKKSVNDNYLTASLEVEPSDIFLITVPTPFKKNNSNIPEPDVSYIKEAARNIAPHLSKNNLIILESTAPVGTTKMLSDLLASIRKDLTFPNTRQTPVDIHIAYCPERVMPGDMLYELKNNDRVIGGLNTESARHAKDFYEIFVKGKCYITNAETAEMTKLTENAFRDVQVAFANELSMICENHNINTLDLIELANKHPRVNILEPGAGVGGHCIAVDPWFIVYKDQDISRIISTARKVNNAKPKWIIKKIEEQINANNSEDLNIYFYGITFKPNIDDLRESPALDIVKYFHSLRKNINVIEPNLNKNKILQNLQNANIMDLSESVHNKGIHVFLVKHDVFKKIKFSNSKETLILDFCGVVR